MGSYIWIIFGVFPWVGAAYYNEIEGTECLTDENPKDFPEDIIQKTLDVFPGTKWCGEKPLTENQEDLGEYPETDKCCRDHDQKCSDIPPGETKWSLTNEKLFSVAECSCDEQLLKCLKAADEKISVDIRFVFFGIQHPPCFKFTDMLKMKAEWSTPVRDPELAKQIDAGEVEL